MKLSIWFFNIKKWEDDIPEDVLEAYGSEEREYAHRVKNVAQLAASKDNDREKAGNIFAFNEAYYEEYPVMTLTGLTWRMKAKEISCLWGEQRKYTHQCFFDHWRSYNIHNIPLDYVGDQYGDVALLASGNMFETNVIDFIKERIGPVGYNLLQYQLIGARIPIKDTNYILPFYSVHIATQSPILVQTGFHISADDRQIESCRDIVNIVRNNWVPGDLPPVVVGDFNFGKFDEDGAVRKQWVEMSTDFYEVNDYFGFSQIEHIWVGKRHHFPDAAVGLIPVFGSFDLGMDFQQKPLINLTDHNCPYVELGVETDPKVNQVFSVLRSTVEYQIHHGHDNDIDISDSLPPFPLLLPEENKVGFPNVVIEWNLRLLGDVSPSWVCLHLFRPKPEYDPDSILPPPVGVDMVRTGEDNELWNNHISVYWEYVPGIHIRRDFPEDSPPSPADQLDIWPGWRALHKIDFRLMGLDELTPYFVPGTVEWSQLLPLRVSTVVNQPKQKFLILLEIKRKGRLKLFAQPLIVSPILTSGRCPGGT